MDVAAVWSLVIGTLIPAATALLTKLKASPKLKALAMAAMSAVTGALSGYLVTPPHGMAQWEQILGSILLTWVAAAASIVTGWKPTGGTVAIARATARFGIGRWDDAHPEDVAA